MTLTLQTAPTAEPFELEEAKQFLNEFHSDNDALITSLIVAARQYAEAFTQAVFVTQVWDYKLDGFPCDESLWLPKAPLLNGTGQAPVVTYVDGSGDTQTWASSYYAVDVIAGPWPRRGRLIRNYGESYPTTRCQPNAVTVRFYCGYGTASAVPDGIKSAMKMLIAHWFRNRETVIVGTISGSLQTSVDAMLWSFKSV